MSAPSAATRLPRPAPASRWRRVRTGALLLSAFGAGLGGILFVGQLGAVSRLLGFGLEFQVYAALMIGGYSILRGGVGNPVGGALGFLVIAGAANILDLSGDQSLLRQHHRRRAAARRRPPRPPARRRRL